MSLNQNSSAMASLADRADEKGLQSVADRVDAVISGMSSDPSSAIRDIGLISRELRNDQELLRLARMAEAGLWKMSAAAQQGDGMLSLRRAFNYAVGAFKVMFEDYKAAGKSSWLGNDPSPYSQAVNLPFLEQYQSLLDSWKSVAASRPGAPKGNNWEALFQAKNAKQFLETAHRNLKEIGASLQAWERLGEISKQKAEEAPGVFRPYFYRKPAMAQQVVGVLRTWQSHLPDEALASLNELIAQIGELGSAPAAMTATAQTHADKFMERVAQMRFLDLDRLFRNAFGTWMGDKRVQAFLSQVKQDLKAQWGEEVKEVAPEQKPGQPPATPTQPSAPTQPTQPGNVPQPQPAQPAATPGKQPLPPVAQAVSPLLPSGRTMRPRGVQPISVPGTAVPAAPAAPAPTSAPAKKTNQEVTRTIREHFESIEQIREALGNESQDLSDNDIGGMLISEANSPEDLVSAAKRMSQMYSIELPEGTLSPEALVMKAIEKLAATGRFSNPGQILEVLGKAVPDLFVPLSVIRMLYRDAMGQAGRAREEIPEAEPRRNVAMTILGPRLAKGMEAKILERGEGKGPRAS